MKKSMPFKSPVCFLLAATSAIVPVEISQAQTTSQVTSRSHEIRLAQASRNCNNALQNAATRIRSGRNISVSLESFNLSERYDEFPRNHPLGYSFSLNGTSTESIMRSPQFMASISQSIMMACEPAGAVGFLANQAGWYVTFGLMENDRVSRFQCVEPGSRLSRRWGYQGCA